MTRAFTPAEVAERLRVSTMTIRRRINDGDIEAVNVGTSHYPRWRVTESALRTYLESITVVRKEPPR